MRKLELYLDTSAISHLFADDTVVNHCDVIASWNFAHLANFKTINKVKVVNAMFHYREINIMPPIMFLEREDEQK